MLILGQGPPFLHPEHLEEIFRYLSWLEIKPNERHPPLPRNVSLISIMCRINAKICTSSANRTLYLCEICKTFGKCHLVFTMFDQTGLTGYTHIDKLTQGPWEKGREGLINEEANRIIQSERNPQSFWEELFQEGRVEGAMASVSQNYRVLLVSSKVRSNSLAPFFI